MFRIVQAGETRSDGTAPFDIVLYQETTVREFLHEVLAIPDDWGYIRIEKGLPFASTPCCPYERGKLLPDAYIPFDEADMDRFVVSATADGGMGRMDYWLNLQEKEPVSGSFCYAWRFDIAVVEASLSRRISRPWRCGRGCGAYQ